jgi:hypothetical protein
MLKHAIKRALAGLVAVVLGTGFAVSTATLATAADTSGQCIVDVIHHPAVEEVKHEEFQYSKVIPGETETFYTEYRFRTRTVTYGTIERKYIYSSWNFVDGGQTNIDGDIVSGHWVNTGSAFWHAIADSVINAVWGPGGVPDNLIGGSEGSPKGNVPLSAYGAPGAAGSAPYYATETSNPSGFTDWGPWSAWSTTDPGAETDTLEVESRETSNNDGTPASTVYYLAGGSPTTTLTDANWTTDMQVTVGDTWTLINQRIVIDVEAKDAYDENVYGDCPTDPCTSQSSTWFGEQGDAIPTFVANGLKFAGPSVPAVRYLHPVSGNLQGVIGTSYTIDEASGYHAALVYIINRFGTSGYATIAIEPYHNGWAPGQTGTFVVTETTKVWTSKIVSGLGSQSQPATIAQMSAIFPDNELLAQGLHLGTNSAADQYTVVSSINGCGDVSFAAPPTVSCFANLVDDDLVLPATQGVLWKVNGNAAVAGPVVVPLTLADVTVEAVPAAGYLFGPGQTSWTFEAGDDGLCQIPTLAQFPTNVAFTDRVCDAGKVVGGTITVGMVGGTPFFTNEVDYFLNGSATPMTQQTVAVAPGTYTLTAAPHDPNDTLEGDTSWTVTITDTDEVCGDLTTLALTGATAPTPWLNVGLLLFTAGLAVAAVQTVRRRTEFVE